MRIRAPHKTPHKNGGWSIGVNAMRSVLALGLLITVCGSADAATAHHFRTHDHLSPGFALRGWAYGPSRSRVHYDDTPSYNDPSKFGGDTALGVDP
jgi:hypothetical protein